MSTVNIILATYNGEKYINEQINSILASTYTDWSLMVCDDVSTDSTVSIVKDYVKRYPERISLHVNEANRGLVANFICNVKAKKQSYSTSNIPQYFMFCDQDDVWLPNKIEVTLQGMKRLEQKYGKRVPTLVFTDAEVVDTNLKTIYHSFMECSLLNPIKTDLPHILMENKCIGCTVMINSALTEYIDRVPSSVRYHDWWVALIAASFGHIGYINVATLKYRQHVDNKVGAQGFACYVIDRMKSLRRQKEVLLATQRQAADFLDVYGESLPEYQKMIISRFSSLHSTRWLRRRCVIIRYHFYKTGILRNIGVLFLS